MFFHLVGWKRKNEWRKTSRGNFYVSKLEGKKKVRCAQLSPSASDSVLFLFFGSGKIGQFYLLTKWISATPAHTYFQM